MLGIFQKVLWPVSVDPVDLSHHSRRGHKLGQSAGDSMKKTSTMSRVSGIVCRKPSAMRNVIKTVYSIHVCVHMCHVQYTHAHGKYKTHNVYVHVYVSMAFSIGSPSENDLPPAFINTQSAARLNSCPSP